MTILIQIIKHLFPSKVITHHICDLLNQLPEKIIKPNYIFVSIEKDNKTRQFFYCIIEELITLYNHCPPNERTLYEMIFPINLVKTYIDFEYYIDNNLDINDHHIGAKCFIKILHYVLNFFDHKHHENENYLHITLQQFLVLESVSELAYLLVMNKQNQHNLAIDLNVYSKNQQFRLYDCVKRGQINFLRQSTYFQFNEPFETSYHTILK
ncbi:unnamed protein product, partial [Rotaria sp. Silwood1]